MNSQEVARLLNACMRKLPYYNVKIPLDIVHVIYSDFVITLCQFNVQFSDTLTLL